MGTLSLERVEKLLWLGRYVERSYTTLRFILSTYDRSLDGIGDDWKGQLEELGFDQDDTDPQEFFQECLFDEDNPSSVMSSLVRAMDNAVVLRDAIGTEAVAYVQLALNDVIAAHDSDTPLLDLQAVTDYIMAFKGCCDDYIETDTVRNLIKCGISIERMDLYTRLDYHLDQLRKETHKLASRIDRTGVPYNRDALRQFIQMVFSPTFPDQTTYEERGEMLTLLAHIF